MTVPSDTVIAYVDGELEPIEAKRVERAMAEDPALAAEVARHRALRTRLRVGFAPVAEAPVPPAVAALLREAATVVPMPGPGAARGHRAGWIAAIAASHVLGVVGGRMIPQSASESGVVVRSDGTLAAGPVATALSTQLASTQAADAPVRIGISFRDDSRALCRTFERRDVAGIACARGSDWRLQRLYGGSGAGTTAYRQAGSPHAAMMAEAQAMAVGDPLDAGQERAALDRLHRAQR